MVEELKKLPPSPAVLWLWIFVKENPQYLTGIVETKAIPGKIYENSGIVHFAEIDQAPSPYSMLQHIGRVATLKLVPGHRLRYLQTALIMEGGGLVSEFLWGII